MKVEFVCELHTVDLKLCNSLTVPSLQRCSFVMMFVMSGKKIQTICSVKYDFYE